MENEPQDYVTGILDRDRLTLARTITLIESTLPAHQELARTIVERLLPYSGRSIRPASSLHIEGKLFLCGKFDMLSYCCKVPLKDIAGSISF